MLAGRVANAGRARLTRLRCLSCNNGLGWETPYAQMSGLGDTLKAETTPVDENERWWVWKCPTARCPGLLHVAGYALDKHALFVVCDGTCAKTFLR